MIILKMLLILILIVILGLVLITSVMNTLDMIFSKEVYYNKVIIAFTVILLTLEPIGIILAIYNAIIFIF